MYIKEISLTESAARVVSISGSGSPREQETKLSTTKNNAISFNLAIRDFFGLKPGQTPAQLLAEVKSLSEADRDELKQELSAAGYMIAP